MFITANINSDRSLLRLHTPARDASAIAAIKRFRGRWNPASYHWQVALASARGVVAALTAAGHQVVAKTDEDAERLDVLRVFTLETRENVDVRHFGDDEVFSSALAGLRGAYPEFLTVLATWRRYDLDESQDWHHFALCREATPEEAVANRRKLEGREQRLRKQRALDRRLDAVRRYLRRTENHAGWDGDRPHEVDGEELVLVNSDLYGGGESVVLTDTYIWYLRGCTGDGDAWADCNVAPGWMGWRVPRPDHAELEVELRALSRSLGCTV